MQKHSVTGLGRMVKLPLRAVPSRMKISIPQRNAEGTPYRGEGPDESTPRKAAAKASLCDASVNTVKPQLSKAAFPAFKSLTFFASNFELEGWAAFGAPRDSFESPVKRNEG
jgi:hypothetical protein